MSSPVKGFEERRQSRRIDMEQAEIRLNWQDKLEQRRCAAGICLDLSRTGALIESPAEVGVGYRIELTLNPGSGDENRISAEVIRVEPADNGQFKLALELIQ
ncbi:PilZ domain-containing protein [Shewanella sp. GXUN23E]|uniref:PilZ domain-containing protein n=1 Tax=Shewanella sp. GXUN23E TaxID=3422498 RepID=UPI003D7E867C